MSNFRTIWVAALASPLLLLIADAAVAQNVTAADQSGIVLAGLRPPYGEKIEKLLKTQIGK